jgi:hypothetical protein
VTIWTLGMGTSSSLVATAIVYWIVEQKTIHALVIGGTGIVVFVLTLLFAKKPASPPAPSVNQEVKQEANPQMKQEVNPQFTQQVTVYGNQPTAAATAPAPEKKPELRHNIQFIGVAQTTITRYVGTRPAPAIAAGFENKSISGQELKTPDVRGRLIFRRIDETVIADVRDVVWVPGNTMSVTMRVNSPESLLLFFVERGQLFTQSLEPTWTVKRGRRLKYLRAADIPINGAIASIEIQVLTDNEELCKQVLKFNGDLPIPRLIG